MLSGCKTHGRKTEPSVGPLALLLSLTWLATGLWGAPQDNVTAAQLAQTIRDAGLDTEECYRVRDLSYYKEDIKLYFHEGYLIFSKPVLGERFSVVFSGDL